MGSPIRILHVVVNMNRGGAETLLMNLYRNIDRSKIQFDFLTCKEGVFDQDIVELGGKVHRIPYISDVGHFNYARSLVRFFQSHLHYKIVHSHLDKMSGLVLKAAKKAGVPVRISHSHNTSSEGGIAAKIYKWYIGQQIKSQATNYYACSEMAAKWLFGKYSKSAFILKNGIDIHHFSPSYEIRENAREEFNLAQDSIVFGHVGRFAHQKNHAFLIDLFAEFSRNETDSVLLLVGDGPLRRAMEMKVLDLKISDKVKFLGIRNDIPRLLQAFDFFLFPSLHEGLPVSLIEAQGAGLPCIISDQISPEVDLGMDLVEFIPLGNKDVWLERIKKRLQVTKDRKVDLDLIKNKGYYIKEAAYQLEEFYLSV